MSAESLARLREALERGGAELGDEAAFYIGRCVASALSAAHAATDAEGNPAPVGHLELCPERVLVATDGEVVLVGLGRRTPGGAGAGADTDASTGERAGADTGTDADADTHASSKLAAREFMAPEERSGGRVTHRADVYRLGLLLWSMLSNRRPPADGSRPESLQGLRSDLPHDLTAAVDAALEPAAGKRTITCFEIEQWLQAIDHEGAGRRAVVEKLARIQAEAQASLEAKPLSAPAPTPLLEIEPPSPSPLKKALEPSIVAERAPSSTPPPPAQIDGRGHVRADRRARPLSALASIGVASATAAIVFAIGTYIGDRTIGLPPAAPHDASTLAPHDALAPDAGSSTEALQRTF